MLSKTFPVELMKWVWAAGKGCLSWSVEGVQNEGLTCLHYMLA